MPEPDLIKCGVREVNPYEFVQLGDGFDLREFKTPLAGLALRSLRNFHDRHPNLPCVNVCTAVAVLTKPEDNNIKQARWIVAQAVTIGEVEDAEKRAHDALLAVLLNNGVDVKGQL